MLRFLMPLLLIPSLLSAQLAKHLNDKIGLPEDLCSKEIRIYKNSGKTDFPTVFRLYQNEEKIWKVEFYEYHYVWGDYNEGHSKKIEVKSSKELNYVWLEILNSDVLYLPEQSAFKYKLKGKAKIEAVEGQYEQVAPRVLIFDGIHYVVQVSDGEKKNSFQYDNPEKYHKYYPDVDELQSFINLKKILKKRFAIAF